MKKKRKPKKEDYTKLLRPNTNCKPHEKLFCKLYASGMKSLDAYCEAYYFEILKRGLSAKAPFETFTKIKSLVTGREETPIQTDEASDSIYNYVDALEKNFHKLSDTYTPMQLVYDCYAPSVAHITKVRASYMLGECRIWKGILTQYWIKKNKTEYDKLVIESYYKTMKCIRVNPFDVYDDLVKENDTDISPLIALKRLCVSLYFFNILQRDLYRRKTKEKVIAYWGLISKVIETEKSRKTYNEVRRLLQSFEHIITLDHCLKNDLTDYGNRNSIEMKEAAI